MDPLNQVVTTAWGTPLKSWTRTVEALRVAAAIAGITLADSTTVKNPDTATAIAICQLSCQLAKRQLSELHRAELPIQQATRRALLLVAGQPLAVHTPTGSASCDDELEWVNGLITWVERNNIDANNVLLTVANGWGDIDGPIGRIAATCYDLSS